MTGANAQSPPTVPVALDVEGEGLLYLSGPITGTAVGGTARGVLLWISPRGHGDSCHRDFGTNRSPVN